MARTWNTQDENAGQDASDWDVTSLNAADTNWTEITRPLLRCQGSKQWDGATGRLKTSPLLLKM